MATLQEVAEACGVSMSTVSRALRDWPTIAEDTRLRVHAVAAEMGYTASPSASSLRSGRHQTIAIAAPPLGPWFYTQAIRGIESLLHARSYSFYLIDTAVQEDGSRRPFSRSTVEKRSDGVIALGIDLSGQEREDLAKVGKPVVIVGAPVPDLHVGIDDVAATRLAMDHLLEQGHRRIAHLGGNNDYGIEDAVAVTRRKQWAASLAEAGVEAKPEWFAAGGFTIDGAKAGARQLLECAERPTAIFAASDEMAFGAILAARDLGLQVPDSLSIVGIDDHAFSGAFGLTSVHQDPFGQGVLAASILLDAVAGDRRPPTIHLEPISLVLRSSTGPVSPGVE